MKNSIRALTGATPVLALAMSAVFLLTAAWLASIYASSPRDVGSGYEERVSREGAVTVNVVPRNLASDAQSWDFEVTLDTHTQPLVQDLISATVLIDSKGNAYTPVSWDGDPPGGHHRNGLLRFRPLPGNQAIVELLMKDVGDVPVRVFRWERQ